MVGKLQRKQGTEQKDWIESIKTIGERVSLEHIVSLVDATLTAVEPVIKDKKVAFAWSGGKDSLVLEHIMYQAGVRECMMGLCDLEYPAFLQWVTDHMPFELELVHTGQDLAWLAKNQDMLFPQTSVIAAKWFKIVQHTAQARYYRNQKLDMIILGRRRMDGNYTGPADSVIYTNAQHITRYSPLADWTHEDILAFIHYNQVPIPPIYDWPNGYRVGTGAWAARQWTGTTEQGWSEVYSIDSSIVHNAAPLISSAQNFLESKGLY